MAAKMQRGLGRGPGRAPWRGGGNQRSSPRRGALPETDGHRPQPRPAPRALRGNGAARTGRVHPRRGRFAAHSSCAKRASAMRSSPASAAIAPRGWRGLTRFPPSSAIGTSKSALRRRWWKTLQRDDLNPMEEAVGVKRLMEAAGLTQERVAERLGKSRPAVANLLRLLTLPEEVQKMLVDGRLTAGHARALVSVDPSRQVQLANLTVQQNWSVRQLERICAQPVQARPQAPPAPGSGTDGTGRHGARPSLAPVPGSTATKTAANWSSPITAPTICSASGRRWRPPAAEKSCVLTNQKYIIMRLSP